MPTEPRDAPSQENYQKWMAAHQVTDPRGQCCMMTAAMAEAFPELRRVRGFYLCPLDGKRPHWWLVTPTGEIVDPTSEQFASNGRGDYEEYLGPEPKGNCLNCGALTFEDTFLCSEQCFHQMRAFLADGGTVSVNGREIS